MAGAYAECIDNRGFSDSPTCVGHAVYIKNVVIGCIVGAGVSYRRFHCEEHTCASYLHYMTEGRRAGTSQTNQFPTCLAAMRNPTRAWQRLRKEGFTPPSPAVYQHH